MSVQWTRVEGQLHNAIYRNGPTGKFAPIQCYGMFGSILSFENVATQLFAEIARYFDEVSFHDYRHRVHTAVPGFEDRSFIYPKAKIAIFHGVVQKALPEVMAGHQFRIGCLVCDADKIPVSEIELCHQSFDLVVIPSKFCQRVFESSGLKTQTLVIPHGITTAFTATANDCEDSFTFYNVYSQMRPFRKSEDELINAFVKAFSLDPGYQLILRTEYTKSLADKINKAQAMQVITVIEDELPEAEYVRSFSQAHALVHPSKAEGFGMIPLQALACETPVIATGVTGLADYLNKDNAMILRTSGMVACKHDVGESIGGQYHAIDEEHLVNCLIEMADNWKQEKQKASQAAASIRENYSWQQVAKPLIAAIENEL